MSDEIRFNAGTIKLLLHAYCHPPEVKFPYEVNVEFLKECRSTLHCNGLLDRADKFAIITEKGKVYVEMILETPLPVKKWVRP
jgi:hypothetical protein